MPRAEGTASAKVPKENKTEGILGKVQFSGVKTYAYVGSVAAANDTVEAMLRRASNVLVRNLGLCFAL